MNDLDWLARNVHEWPESTPHIIAAGDGVFEYGATFCENHACIYRQGFTNSKIIYKLQWLSRRAELQNKPSWGEVPADANYMTQGSDGAWGCWNDKPAPVKEKNGNGDTVEYWGGNNPLSSFNMENKRIGEVLGDWRDTLEKRPDMYKKPEEMDTSDERVQKTEESVHISELEMLAKVSHLISDKRNRDQLDSFVSAGESNTKFPRDVDYVGKINAAVAKQQAPKGSGSPILGMVLADLTNRALEGKEKYGEPLLAHNGRNPLWDAYQEALDLAMYLRQAIEEHNK